MWNKLYLSHSTDQYMYDLHVGNTITKLIGELRTIAEFDSPIIGGSIQRILSAMQSKGLQHFQDTFSSAE